MITIYGIKSCDTCRKARQAAEKSGKSVTFVDVRETPLGANQTKRFLDEFGEALVNRKSSTWRALEQAERDEKPEVLLARHPTLMKRPVIEGASLTIGWTQEIQKTHLG